MLVGIWDLSDNWFKRIENIYPCGTLMFYNIKHLFWIVNKFS